MGSPTTLPSTSVGVAGDQVRQDRVLDRGRRARGVMDLALQPVAGAGDRVAVGRVHHHLDGGHLVQRQRAGLVGVDRRGEPERLHRREVLHDRVALGQVDPADRQDGLRHRGQGLGDGRDGQRDRADEQRVPGQVTLAAQDEHHDHGQPGRRRDPQGELVQFPGQRRLLPGGGGQHPGDLPQLGARPRAGDDHRAAAVRDRRVHERHVALVTRPELLAGQRLGVLGGRRALPGQRGVDPPNLSPAKPFVSPK